MKKTPLHTWHVSNHANMAGFGEYEMPLWYKEGVKKEHLAVIETAGVFDTSHMNTLILKGKGAFDLLQACFTRDLNKFPFPPGFAVYGLFLDKQGETVDDAILYRMNKDVFLIVVNSGMGETVSNHLKKFHPRTPVDIIDISETTGKIDLQGPTSAKILNRILKSPDEVFQEMPYFSFKGNMDKRRFGNPPVYLKGNIPVLLSRTGYTGEFGFEIFTKITNTEKIWEMLLKEGNDLGLIPCGLAARDSLRTGAVLPLSHQDIGHWPFIHTPWDFALPYYSDKTCFTKPFIGSEALSRIETPEYTLSFVGYDLRKVSVQDPAIVLSETGEKIGHVLTCVTDMAISRVEDKIYSISSPDKPEEFVPKGLCCGFIKVKERLFPGHIVELKDNRRTIKVMITDDIRPGRSARNPIDRML